VGYVILVQRVPEISNEAWERGLSLSVSRQLKRNPIDALNPAWKTGNYLNNMQCLREAKGRGADDVVILNHRECVTESSTSNIAFIRDGCFLTTPLSAGLLAGITRQILLNSVASRAGLEVVERPLAPSDFSTMEECMLTSSTKDVQPVGRIDEIRFKVGEGTATRRLKRAFADYAFDYASRHPEQKI
jgi:branched-subunit amino acid aminotransferase/4-amino-4-deoxychorismate lyase